MQLLLIPVWSSTKEMARHIINMTTLHLLLISLMLMLLS